ncbi:MAG: hypothetical protein GW778_03950 [Alphaproteobacteria bacterium]|nr:hypothetical protein [Alphaproteobacteria bacterium]
MEQSHFILFLQEYKAVLGGLSIAIATIIAVYFNYIATRKAERRLKHENTASHAAAIAAELTDNADNLTDLYFEIENKKLNARKIAEYQEFNTLVYKALLSSIGDLGAALSYMVVDVYGDLSKLSLRLELAKNSDIQAEQEELLWTIKRILSKTMTTSIVILLYSDRLNGRSYVREVHDKRVIWMERMLDKFCTYVSEAEDGFEFIGDGENPNGDFAKRFARKEDRDKIRYLIRVIGQAVNQSNKSKIWRSSLVFRALAYEIHDVLKYFLNIERSVYDQTLQEEYRGYLKR